VVPAIAARAAATRESDESFIVFKYFRWELEWRDLLVWIQRPAPNVTTEGCEIGEIGLVSEKEHLP